MKDMEDITWPCGDTKFLFECWKYFTSERSERVKYFFNTRREISYLGAAMYCSIYYINTNELPNHFTLTGFWCERRDLLLSHSNGDIFTCEDNMLFSHVKIPSFRAKAHLVFHWCLYNKGSYHLRWWGDLTSFTSWHGSFDQKQARICELYQFRPRLYGEKLSLVDWTPPYSSYHKRWCIVYMRNKKSAQLEEWPSSWVTLLARSTFLRVNTLALPAG